jgi:lycopene beta-cyclase
VIANHVQRVYTLGTSAGVPQVRVANHIVIAGAGPAGLALAGSLLRGGARVTVVDPTGGAPWTQRFGVWTDEFPLSNVYATRYATARVERPAGATTLRRSYARLDVPALQRHLASESGGAARVADRVAGAEHGPAGVTVHLARGGSVPADVYVDASGAPSADRPVAEQVAFGQLVYAPGHRFAVDEAVFMDWRPVEDGGPPTFAYVLPFDADHVFVEETSLAARPGVSMTLLERRLAARRRGYGVEGPVLETERCRIRLDTPPPGRTPELRFGAAAGLAHPATGYQLTRALHLADPVAAALLADHRDAAAAVRAAQDVVWTAAARSTRALHDLGLEVLLRLDAAGCAAFFGDFFALPPARVSAFLDARSTPFATAGAMAALFRSASPATRNHILGTVGARARDVARHLVPSLGGAV